MNMLMRSLQVNACERRRDFFSEVRTCRRRKQVPWETTPLVHLFQTGDEYILLHQRATVTRVRNLMQSKGMYLLDAFRLFDYDKDDSLTSQELYGGLTWLGLNMSAREIQDLVQSIDLDGNGRISFAEFKAAFRNPYSDVDEIFEDTQAFDSRGVVVEPRLLGDEEEAPIDRELTAAELNGITCSTVVATSFSEIWTSYGSMSHNQVGIWATDTSVGALNNPGRRVRIPIGDYCAENFKPPSLSNHKQIKPYKRLFLELYDTAPIMSSSRVIKPALDQQFPLPTSFHLVWQQLQGQKTFYAWQGVPPSDKFICIGMVGTTSEVPPPLERCRCVPRAYLVASPTMPSCIWDDSGTGGQRGSIWVGSSFNTMWVKKGHDAPGSDTFWEMKGDKFTLDELPEYVAPPRTKLTAGAHREGLPPGHAWLVNQVKWCNNEVEGDSRGVSEVYRPTGANGPVTNLVDNNLNTIWNANRADKQQWVRFDFKARHALSAFKYYRGDQPEAPKECELKVFKAVFSEDSDESVGGEWVTVVKWTGTRGAGWTEDYLFPDGAVEAQHVMWVIENTHAERTFYGRLNRSQGANVNQVEFHGKAL